MAKYQYQPGERVFNGRYIIKERLDEGAFAEIYLAEDTENHNKECVIKNFSPKYRVIQDKPSEVHKLRERFETEANLLRRINHPYVPQFLDFDKDNALIVEEYIQGKNLYKELFHSSQGILNEQEIWKILNQILPILIQIHSLGIYHRDISPKNILREKNSNCLFLIDFGLGKGYLYNNSNDINSILGKYGSYESPYDKDKKDLHDLGATCCHLLSNDSPGSYTENSGYDWFENWKLQLEPQGIKPSNNLLTILKKLVTGQYDSAQQAYEEVQPKPTKNFITKNWKCINTIKIDGFYRNCNYNNISIAVTPDGETIISGTPDGHIKFWETKTGKLIKSVQVIEDDKLLFPFQIALSNNGNLLATTSITRYKLQLWKLSDLLNLDNCQPIAIINKGSSYEDIEAFSFSYDDQILATCHSNEMVRLWLLKDSQGVKEIRTLYPFKRNEEYSYDDYDTDDYDTDDYDTAHVWFKDIAFNPKQESQIAVCFFHSRDDESYPNNIVIWDKYTGEIIKKLSGHLDFTYSISFSSDGKTLVSSGTDQKVKIWNIETSQELFSLSGHYKLSRVVCSPTEPIIASGGQDDLINIYNLENGDKLQSINEHSYPVNSLVFSQDGKLLISSASSRDSEYGEIKIWQQE